MVEWEYACRAGSTTRYYWGDNMDPSHCWHKKNAKGRTHPPETHNEAANGFGLVDTLGNIYEACQDRYYPDYHGSFPTDGRPRGDDRGTYRVRRGGGWCGEDEKCQSAYRAPYPRWKAVSTLGYRLVRSIP
jgi:formylglycine-generating enzyme required for sulfatase activity